MEIKQLQTVRTGQEVAAYLRERIACGEWGVGYRLPAQRQLASELGVGRQAVRQGISHLEAEGYLMTRRGARGGSFVGEPSTPVSVWRELLRANLPDMEDLIDFRSAIEQRICALAALRRSDSDLQAMQTAIEALPAAADRGTVVARPGIDHPVIVGTAEGTPHENSPGLIAAAS